MRCAIVREIDVVFGGRYDTVTYCAQRQFAIYSYTDARSPHIHSLKNSRALTLVELVCSFVSRYYDRDLSSGHPAL